MTLTVSRILAAAAALWRRDRDLLVRIAVPFVLLPSLAFQLLVPPLIVPFDTPGMDVLRLQSQFVSDHAGAYLLLTFAIPEYGRAAMLAWYLDPQAGDVRGALRRATILIPQILLLAFLLQVATGAGLLLFAVPGLIVAGRTLPAAAALLAERPAGVVAALRRAVRATRGHTLTTAALAALLIGGRLLVLYPFLAMDRWLRGLHASNPVALAVIDAAAAGVEMLAAIAGVLIAVVLYRSLATGKGVASRGT